ncbi:hypothetical protein ABE24_10250 [Cytobacillus firmus]|nr:hypothetical protein [Cytobacillus firmus]
MYVKIWIMTFYFRPDSSMITTVTNIAAKEELEMKKWLLAMMAVLMITGVATGCSNEDDTDETNTEETEDTGTEEGTEEDSEEGTEEETE